MGEGVCGTIAYLWRARKGLTARDVNLRRPSTRALLAAMGNVAKPGFAGVVLVVLLSLPARAAGEQYSQCVASIAANPDGALSRALTWAERGGGAAAEHCAALALIALKRPAEAAARLDRLAQGQAGDARNRATLYDQAGNAWLMAGQPQNAEGSFTSALALTPNDADILIDRAGARGLRKNWTGAETDLTQAYALNRSNPEILVLRASARAAQGRKDEARADIEAALAINPIFPDALVERGAMKLAAGDKIGARADWQQALTAAPGSAAAATAKQYLSGLDASMNNPPPK